MRIPIVVAVPSGGSKAAVWADCGYPRAASTGDCRALRRTSRGSAAWDGYGGVASMVCPGLDRGSRQTCRLVVAAVHPARPRSRRGFSSGRGRPWARHDFASRASAATSAVAVPGGLRVVPAQRCAQTVGRCGEGCRRRCGSGVRRHQRPERRGRRRTWALASRMSYCGPPWRQHPSRAGRRRPCASDQRRRRPRQERRRGASRAGRPRQCPGA